MKKCVLHNQFGPVEKRTALSGPQPLSVRCNNKHITVFRGRMKGSNFIAGHLRYKRLIKSGEVWFSSTELHEF